MEKISKILDKAASKLGMVNAGEALRPEDANLFLDQLKYNLYEMSIRFFGAKCYDYTVSAKNPLTLGSTISVSGDILERPALIEAVQIIRGDLKYNLPIRSYKDFLDIKFEFSNGSVPSVCYLKDDHDLYTLYFHPQLTSGDLVHIYGRSYIVTEDLSYSDYLEVPNEYLKGIILHLAASLENDYGTTQTTGPNSLYNQGQSALKHIRDKMLLEKLTTPKNSLGNSRGFLSPNDFYSGNF